MASTAEILKVLRRVGRSGASSSFVQSQIGLSLNYVQHQLRQLVLSGQVEKRGTSSRFTCPTYRINKKK